MLNEKQVVDQVERSAVNSLVRDLMWRIPTVWKILLLMAIVGGTYLYGKLH